MIECTEINSVKIKTFGGTGRENNFLVFQLFAVKLVLYPILIFVTVSFKVAAFQDSPAH